MYVNKFDTEGYHDPTAVDTLEKIARDEIAINRKPLVFICSPFAGNISQNTQNAKRYMRFAVDAGVIPFAPHLLYPQVLDDDNPKQREIGLLFGMAWLGKCDELWVFGRFISPGMTAEIDTAKQCHITIRYFTENCEEANLI